MTNKNHLRNLIRTSYRRLQYLEEQQARQGLNSPPEILMEIEDIKAKIEDLEAELNQAESLRSEPIPLIGELAYIQEQLNLLETSQRSAPDPQRFQDKIEELKHTIANWEGRVEDQRQRITAGLEKQRQETIERDQPKPGQKRVRVIGRPPLGEVEYFKDRQQERVTIGRLLTEPSTRLVSVIGQGGMGKTALVSKILADLERHRWPHTDEGLPLDGILYLSTRTAGISLERLFLDCAQLLGGETEKKLNTVWVNPNLGIEDKISNLLEALQNGFYVILLDNLEDLLDDQGQLVDQDLRLFFERGLTKTYGARLLVTSRVTLAFKGETMRFDRQVKLLDGLPVEDGIALLRELDPNGDYGLRDAPVEQLAQAVSLVHGVPRALEVLVGILANDPFASLTEVVEQFYQHDDVVEALIEENYKRLDVHARRVIEALSIFKRPVPPLAVDFLLEPFFPGLDAPEILRRLARTNILTVDRATKTVVLHPIDQDYAYSQLPETIPDEHPYTRRVLERRAADYYIQLRTPPETWKSITDLEPQLVEFEHRVRAGDYEDACRILDHIDLGYLFRWGHYARLIILREKLLGQLKELDLKAANLGRLGNSYRAQGQVEQSIKFHTEALAIARQIGDRREEGIRLGEIGFAYRRLGQVERAIAIYEESLTIVREIGDRLWEGGRLGSLGTAYMKLGKFQRAIEFYNESLIILRELKERGREGGRLGNLGQVYFALGQVERAINLYEQALLIARETDNPSGQQLWLGSLGLAYQALGQFEHAIQLHNEALIINRQIGNEHGESYALLGLSRALLTLGSLSEAEYHCKTALALNVVESSFYLALVLATIHLHQHNPNVDKHFADTITRCRTMLDETAGLYEPRYILATAFVGKVICDPSWMQKDTRVELLKPALIEYQDALKICDAPGVVQDTLRNLELIHTAGVEGLEPIFELLTEALKQNGD